MTTSTAAPTGGPGEPAPSTPEPAGHGHAGQPGAAARVDASAEQVRLAQRVGQALALPVAALPAAGFLLRLGQPDLLGRWHVLSTLATVCSAAGGAVLDYLPLAFALGLGLGLPRGRDRTGPVLASVVAYLVLARTVLALCPPPGGQADTAPARWPYGALAGIVGGLLAVAVWRYVDSRRIPAFAGHALVAVTAAATGWLMSLAWPAVDRALTDFASSAAHHPVIGGGAFGALNRAALPVGLHQVPNTVAWYLTGKCDGGYTGDIPCFLHGDPRSGIFLGGFFPIAMLALPAAALAMWRSAPPDQRRAAAQILLPAAAMSALFGVTEPLEFAFAFVSVRLFAVHAALTGTSLAVVNALHVHDGFLFSAGLADWLFNFNLATRPLWLLPIGAGYALVYYAVFRLMITRLDLPTPGRAGRTKVPSDAADAAHSAVLPSTAREHATP
jgi:N-acetylglucosamine PTS system EIICBA or EIICB component